jgi:DNA-binding response OmpR family regulator
MRNRCCRNCPAMNLTILLRACCCGQLPPGNGSDAFQTPRALTSQVPPVSVAKVSACSYNMPRTNRCIAGQTHVEHTHRIMHQSAHILIIEDDPAVAQSLVDCLAREGYRVTWTATGAEGIAVLRSHHPHLIILDIRLPDGSGLDVCRQLRTLGLHQPVLILTVQREEIDKVLGLEMGADDYLTKPFGLRELLARVRALLRRSQGAFATADANLLYVADLVIDRARGHVSRGKHLLQLTPTEFRLLVYLVTHAGQALTRSQLLDAVWGYPAEPQDERTVNVHIRRLREKIEIDPSRPALILTVPGIGYRFTG